MSSDVSLLRSWAALFAQQCSSQTWQALQLIKGSDTSSTSVSTGAFDCQESCHAGIEALTQSDASDISWTALFTLSRDAVSDLLLVVHSLTRDCLLSSLRPALQPALQS